MSAIKLVVVSKRRTGVGVRIADPSLGRKTSCCFSLLLQIKSHNLELIIDDNIDDK